MKREDLLKYSGQHVIIILDGKEDMFAATLHAVGSDAAFLRVTLLKPEEIWVKTVDYVLTDAVVESLSLSERGTGGLIGPIYLKRDGDSLIWDTDSQP